MQTLWHLENIDLTAILCPGKLSSAEIMANHLTRTVAKGEAIYVQQELADRIFFIMEGRVKISTTNEDGKEITKAILNKGEVFGEMALAGEEHRRDEATALEETTLCIIQKNAINGLLRERGDLAMFFMQIFGRRQLEIERRLEALVFKDSRSRIIEFLIELVEEKGQRVGYEWVVRNFMTHQQIANMTATSRQTVTTTLNDLRTENLLTFDRRRLLVRDLDGLKKEAKS